MVHGLPHYVGIPEKGLLPSFMLVVAESLFQAGAAIVNGLWYFGGLEKGLEF